MIRSLHLEICSASCTLTSTSACFLLAKLLLASFSCQQVAKSLATHDADMMTSGRSRTRMEVHDCDDNDAAVDIDAGGGAIAATAAGGAGGVGMMLTMLIVMMWAFVVIMVMAMETVKLLY